MDFKEAFSLGAVIVLLIVFFVMLKLKNRKIRLILHNMKDEGRPAPAKKKKSGAGGVVSVDMLEEGSVLVEDVHDPGGKVVLLDAGTVLTKKNIDKLKNWEIKSVLVK